MMPPRRTGDPDLVAVMLGVEVVRTRARRLVDSLVADGGDDAPACDDDLVDCLLGLEALIRLVELPGPATEPAPIEPPPPSSVERLLR